MSINRRISILFIIFCCFYLVIVYRLFYWQILNPGKAKNLAWGQYISNQKISPFRGDILSHDGLPLVTSQKAYLLFANFSQLSQQPSTLAQSLTNILLPHFISKIATNSADINEKEEREKLEKNFEDKLSIEDLDWIALEHKIKPEFKEKIESLGLKELGFEEEQTRLYPESSMAAHLLGFVGQDETGQDKGYFGLEGFYDLQLKGRPGTMSLEKDATNKPILIGSFITQEKKDGDTLTLYLDKAVQYLVEKHLQKAIERYKAKSGYVVVMDPFTGGIVAMGSQEKYEPEMYFKYEKDLYKNPVIANTYEPGSTFKIFVMAAGIDKKVVKPETKCDFCDRPYKIDKYFIRTWDDKYHPDTTMTEVIKNSDNVGMVFVANKLGIDTFWNYLSNFGFGESTGIDLQEETNVFLKNKKDWSTVDLATAAFGQGISVTGIQLIRAASVIANGGNLIEPHVVKEIKSGNKVIEIKPKVVRNVIKPETAEIITEMMVNAVNEGEAKWTRIKGYKIAGKTGTAQIPIAGHYDKEKTVASFVGFAPANKPKFIILVTLREPETSPWASETAAPLFFNISRDLFTYYGIQPE